MRWGRVRRIGGREGVLEDLRWRMINFFFFFNLKFYNCPERHLVCDDNDSKRIAVTALNAISQKEKQP